MRRYIYCRNDSVSPSSTYHQRYLKVPKNIFCVRVRIATSDFAAFIQGTAIRQSWVCISTQGGEFATKVGVCEFPPWVLL